MSIENTIVTILLLLVSTASITVILYWHLATHGTWRQWPAGQSLMGLLTIIAAGFGWGGVNRLLGDYALKQPILCFLYGGVVIALVMIGVTIHKELRLGRARVLAKVPPATGPVAVIVATTTEEKPNGRS